MVDKQFNYGDVLGFGWRVMKAYFGFFCAVVAIFMFISSVPDIIRYISSHSAASRDVKLLVAFITFIVGLVVDSILGIGIIKIGLSFCDEIKPQVAMLFDAWDCFWRYLGARVVFMLIVLGGLLLFIIPGIIFSIQFSLWPYFVIDKGLGPIEALKASSMTTKGVKWELFLFSFLCGLINLAGLLCLFVGFFAAYPTVLIATTLVYRQLVAQTPELAEFGIDSGAPAHGGGDDGGGYSGPVEVSGEVSEFRRPQSNRSDDDSGPDIGDVTQRD